MKDSGLVGPQVSGMCSFPGGLQEGYSETWKNIMTRIYGAIVAGYPGDDYPTFRDGWAIQKVVAAAVESHRAARWVSVDY